MLFTDSKSQFSYQMWARIYRPAGKLRIQLKRNPEEFYRSLGTLSGESVRTQAEPVGKYFQRPFTIYLEING